MEELLTPPEEKKLPAPEEKLLRPPTLWEKYAKFRWLTLLLLLILILISISIFINKTSNISQTTQLPAPTQPLPTYLPTPTADPTANWKTYTNSKYRFTIKFPPNMQDTHGDSYDLRLENGEILITFGIFGVPKEKAIKELAVNGFCFAKKEDVSETKINGIATYRTEKVFNDNNICLDALINLNTEDMDSYDVLDIQAKATNQNGVRLFNQILSTFKFLDQTADTSSWKTYTSQDSLFSFKYPPEWTFPIAGSALFENKPMPTYQGGGYSTENGRVYGEISISTGNQFCGIPCLNISSDKFVDLYITGGRGAGGLGTTEKVYESTIAGKRSVTVISHPTKSYEGLDPNQITISNFIYMGTKDNDVQIMTINFSYDKNNPVKENEIEKFNKILSTLKFTQ